MAPAQNVETQKQKKPALKTATARQKRTFNAKGPDTQFGPFYFA